MLGNIDAVNAHFHPQGTHIMADLKAQFERAVAESKSLPEKPDNMTLLKIYALYKQASSGDGRRLEDVAPGESTLGHCFLLLRSGHLGASFPLGAVSTLLQGGAKCLPSSGVIAQSRGHTRDHERYTPNSLL